MSDTKSYPVVTWRLDRRDWWHEADKMANEMRHRNELLAIRVSNLDDKIESLVDSVQELAADVKSVVSFKQKLMYGFAGASGLFGVAVSVISLVK